VHVSHANDLEVMIINSKMVTCFLLLATSTITGINYSISPVNAGCQRSRGLARISNKDTGETLSLLNKVEVFECGNTWRSNGGYEFKGEMVQWIKCWQNCSIHSKGKYVLFFQNKEQGTGVVETFAGVICMWQVNKKNKYCWKPLKDRN